ncbi:hypothetical protein ACFX1T_002573 [Malus domestica]
MRDRDVFIWSSMIAGFGVNGQGGEALKVFDRMVKHSAVKPDDVAFLLIYSACSNSGLPGPKHYGILVDLFGRAGELEKALEIVERLPNPAAPNVWGALLGACRIHNKAKLGEVAEKNLIRLDPKHEGHYILLSNIYAIDNNWENMANLRNLIKEKGLKAMSGQSMVEAAVEAVAIKIDSSGGRE